MAKVKVKDNSGLAKFNRFLTFVLVILLVATIAIVIFSSPKVAVQENSGEIQDVSVVDPAFKAGTYGGVDFASEEDVVNYYIECYNKTKAKTADYIDSVGAPAQYYAMLGEDNLLIEDLLIDGKENAAISNLVPGIAGGLFSHGLNGLPPSRSCDPLNDNDDDGVSYLTSRLTQEDILATNVADNGDGTITLTIQPKLSEMSVPGKDAQGRFFMTLGDITGVVDSISALSWASGDTASNILCHYMGGTGTIKIDTAAGEIVEADYNMVVKIEVNHANIAVIKDKSASLTIKYDMHYPASDEYMMENKSVKRA